MSREVEGKERGRSESTSARTRVRGDLVGACAVESTKHAARMSPLDDRDPSSGVPSFFFYLTHVCAILRHNGVNLGKRDDLGAPTMRAPEEGRSRAKSDDPTSREATRVVRWPSCRLNAGTRYFAAATGFAFAALALEKPRFFMRASVPASRPRKPR